MDYFAGLDISMDETHVCVLDREGVVVRESKTTSMAAHLSPPRGERLWIAVGARLERIEKQATFAGGDPAISTVVSKRKLIDLGAGPPTREVIESLTMKLQHEIAIRGNTKQVLEAVATKRGLLGWNTSKVAGEGDV